MPLNFNLRHPLYEQTKALREKALDLYEGGRRVEGREKYLTRHPFETDRQYAIRLERSTYRNFAAPIVDVFASYICENRPEGTLPAVLKEMLPDVDRRGTGADVFFANQARLAAARGVSFILVDMEPARGVTRAEDRLAGRRDLPYFAAIDPDDVLDWRLDERGLAWCVIHSFETLPAAPFEMPLARDLLTVWTREGWQRYAGEAYEYLTAPRPGSGFGAGFGSGFGGGMTLEAEGTHALGEPPLAPILFEPVTAMTGNAATDDVLSLILRVYRRDSELDKMLFDCAVPLGVFNGLDPEQIDDFVRSSSNVLMSSQPGGIEAQYVEPGGASYAALRETLQTDVASIREIAMRMVRPLSGVGESAESKNIDRQQLDTQLASFARRCADGERKCWELAYKWLNYGKSPARDEIETPYNEDYSPKDAERLDRDFALEMLRAGVISRQTCLELLRGHGALPSDFDVEAEAARLEMEMKAGGGAWRPSMAIA